MTLPSINVGITGKRYFQYKIAYKTDATTLNPEIRSVNIAPSHFDGSNTPAKGQTFTQFQSFSEALGASNSGRVRYQITNDVTQTNRYYYNNGTSTWTLHSGAVDYIRTNTAAEINLYLGTFHTQVGTGTFSFRAFLNSATPTERAILDQVNLGYTP